ncbi:MAG: hypothetical protein ACREI3_02285 [Nitrospirales bacterium]
MQRIGQRVLFYGLIGLLACLMSVTDGLPQAQASCGSVTCFLVIGSQAGVPTKGTLTTNFIYNYIPQGTLLDGTAGIIPAVEVDDRKIVLNEHREIRTISQFYTMDLNYGLTDRFAIQATLPYIVRSHRHNIEQGTPGEEATLFTDNGLGDLRLTAKYNILPTLRSVVVLGAGIELPTGKFNQNVKVNGMQSTQEPPVQLGRGNVGLIGTFYQAYELIPHRLNQFSSASYRHTFRNDNGYQFGDEYLLNIGMNVQALDWLVLTGQFNWRYLVHDNFSGSLESHPGGVVLDTNITDRRVPNTGSTTLMFTPGFTVAAWPGTALYFNAQVPVVRDFNNNLAQGVSYVAGVTKSFQLFQ